MATLIGVKINSTLWFNNASLPCEHKCVRNELGINKSNIIQCCKKRVRQAGGFIWRYAKGGDADGTHSM